MHWTEPATSDDSHAELEKKLWDASNQLWAGASLKPSEYSPTVLGLISDCGDMSPLYRRDMSRAISAVVPAQPEGANVGQAVNEAMRAIEKENPDLADVLPTSYHILESRTLASLLKTMASISMDKGGESEADRRYLFDLIYDWSGATKSQPKGSSQDKRSAAYQYFLGKFRTRQIPKHTAELVLA
ncbi:MAG: hypothetical protein ACRCXD_19365 [Luteolibacter sp.]